MAKERIFDSFVVGKSDAIAQSGLFDMTPEPGPTGETVFVRDCELRGAEAEMGCEDFLVCCAAKIRMEFPKPLRTAELSCGVLPEKIFRLVLEVVEIRICGKAFDRHGELPFVCPKSALNGLKVSSIELRFLLGGLLSFPRTGCAPCAG